MQAPLLTIAIPTYNRAGHLAILLDVLAKELAGHSTDIEVLIFDNASPDDTPAVTAAFVARVPACRVVRHAQNIGSAPNFQACFEAATGRYFWMLGDDDAPARGLVGRLLQVLAVHAPHLAYLESVWAPDITPLLDKHDASGVTARLLDRASFARRTNVWLTFISGVVIDRQLLANDPAVRQYAARSGMYFSQLSWTLRALQVGERFVAIDAPCIVATRGNSGGYGLIKVFGCEFPNTVHALLGNSREAKIIIRRAIVCFLPSLLWALRTGVESGFRGENPWPALRRQHGGRLVYWGLLLPMGRFSDRAASPFYWAWRVVNKAFREFDHLMMRQPPRVEAH